MSAELLDEAADDSETVVIAWQKPMLPDGSVANDRKSGGPLPFYLVNHVDADESVEHSTTDALVSIHVLTHKSAGEATSRDEANRMHRRMLYLARYLPDVELADGRIASIDFVDLGGGGHPPKRVPYGDPLILRRVGRYRIGFGWARL